MKFKAYGHACGCKFDQSQWLNLCPKHKDEHDALHRQAQADYAAKQPKPVTP